jgi:hypothetical protein
MAGFMDYFTGGAGGTGFDLFGAEASGMNDLLTAQQQEAIKRQSMLAMAAQLLQAGGRSTQRTSLGQALGQGVMAGQQAQEKGTTGAVNQMLLRSKLDEAKRAQAQREQMSKLLLGDGAVGGEGMDAATQAINAPVAVAGPVGPTLQRAAMIPQMPVGMPAAAPAGMPAAAPTGMPAAGSPFAGLSQTQRALMAGLPADQQGKAMMDYLSGRQKFGAPQTFMRGGQPVVAQQNEFGEERVMEGVTPYEAAPSAIKEYEFAVKQGFPGTFQQFDTARKKAGASSVTVPIDIGQKGFENERGLGKDFRSEPIYKDFSDMQTAYTQVVSSLKQGTPIGDVAGATKVMKLLDPGSVVRESELGIAMAAGGRMDRLQNYFNNLMTGQKLTPQQRDDFERLSNELYAAAGQAYNQKRAEYMQMGDAYGFKNLGTVLGKPAAVPTIMRAPVAAPAGGAAAPARPSLGNIFGG